MTITAYRNNCVNYKPGDDKCRYLCGTINKDPEPLCYTPMIKDLEEWDRMDQVLKEFARRQQKI